METRRLNWRKLELGDEKYIFPEVDEELTRYWIGWEPPRDIEEQRENIKKKVLRAKTLPNAELIIFDQSGDFVGCCGITPSLDPGEFGMDIWVRHSKQGNGYGKEMLRMLVSWAKNNTSLSYLIYSYTEGNERSAAIIHGYGAPLHRTVMYEKRGAQKQVFDHRIELK